MVWYPSTIHSVNGFLLLTIIDIHMEMHESKYFQPIINVNQENTLNIKGTLNGFNDF